MTILCQTVTVSSALSIGNSIWARPDDNPTNVANRCINGKIEVICLLLGNWNTDGTISYYWTNNQIITWKNTIKIKSSELKVIGWVQTSWNITPPDISSTTNRTAMINRLKNSVIDMELDGINEDLEKWRGSFDNIISFWNEIATVMYSINKISSIDKLVCYDTITYPTCNITDILPNLTTNTNHLYIMLYNGGAWSKEIIKERMNTVLNMTPIPAIVSLRVDLGTSLADQLIAIDEQLSGHSYPKLKGFALWEYRGMNDSKWTTWNNWTTKN